MPERWLADGDIDQIRWLRQKHPAWSRCQLSVHLTERWQWRPAAGRPMDIAAPTLLLKLPARGLITLPAPRTRNGNRAPVARRRALQPLALKRVATAPQRRRVTKLLRQHHYQGYSGAVGENVQYLIRNNAVGSCRYETGVTPPSPTQTG